MHTTIFSLTVTGFGAEQAAAMKQFVHTHALLALLRDGFNPLSLGGKVGLRSDGSPELDFP